MKTRFGIPGIIVSFFCLSLCHLAAQGTAFTYQGRLNQNGAPYSGTAEFQASLWAGPAGGASFTR